ncbi:hypothetical protein EST38_g9796 [Candolleomyces aberdarensis]|uniref:Small ribosomal subunit protein mS29 n=1 Tax=Candolleomyces aberdarensis TaxID=2316362 RepID=A0A4Q2D921_9AGAR|nr:hypothetical protein EST38_g9796 [Candolleomyces aberdarensis]
MSSSILSAATSGAASCSQRSLVASRLLVHQTRGAAQKAPAVKVAQSIGGVKKGQKDKWERKIGREYTHRQHDIPVFTRMSEDKLKLPKTDKSPAVLPEQFQPMSTSLNLPLFEPKAITRKNVGTAAGFDLTPTNPAKVFGLPKKMFLEFRILSTPCSVIRDVTVETKNKLEKAKDSSSKDSRIVLTGRAGCGKSFLLHQAVQYAKSEGWIVLYIPRAKTLINSTTTYTYDLRTQTYLQPQASYRIVEKLLTVNSDALSTLTLSAPFTLGGDQDKSKLQVFKEGTKLSEVAQACVKDKSYQSACGTLEVLMRELEGQTKFPVLMAIDDFQSLFHDTAYRDPFFRPIKSHHLSLPRLILEYASGKRNFAKGAFLSALTASDTQYAIPLELQDTLELGHRHPVSPYVQRSETLLQYASGLDAKAGGLQNLKVPEKFSVEEAQALFEVWKDDLALTNSRHDETFMAKYVESDGNPRDFVWKGVLASYAPS